MEVITNQRNKRKKSKKNGNDAPNNDYCPFKPFVTNLIEFAPTGLYFSTRSDRINQQSDHVNLCPNVFPRSLVLNISIS